MSGSINQRRVAEIICASQSDWRDGYEAGKKRQGCGNRRLEHCSRSFQDGYYRGYNESLGKKLPETKTAPSRMSHEEEAIAQRERARYLANRDQDIPESVLSKCHPAFREEYNETLADIDRLYDVSESDNFEDEELLDEQLEDANRRSGY